MPAFRQVVVQKFKDMATKDAMMAAQQRYADHFKANAMDIYHCNSARLIEDGTCCEWTAIQYEVNNNFDIKALFATYPHMADMGLMRGPGGCDQLSCVVSCAVEDQPAVEAYMSKTAIPHPNLSFDNEPIDLATIERQFGYE